MKTINNANNSNGFSLIEMMIVMAIFITLLVLIAPSYQQMTLGNRMISEVYSLRAILNNARSEAMTRRAPVVICPSSNGTACLTNTDNWEQGYMAFVDTDGDNAPDPSDPDEELLKYQTPGPALNIVFDNASRRVRFDPLGEVVGFQGTFVFCDQRGQEAARGLVLTAVGSVRGARDSDDPEDEIVNGAGGDNVDC